MNELSCSRALQLHHRHVQAPIRLVQRLLRHGAHSEACSLHGGQKGRLCWPVPSMRKQHHRFCRAEHVQRCNQIGNGAVYVHDVGGEHEINLSLTIVSQQSLCSLRSPPQLAHARRRHPVVLHVVGLQVAPQQRQIFKQVGGNAGSAKTAYNGREEATAGTELHAALSGKSVVLQLAVLAEDDGGVPHSARKAFLRERTLLDAERREERRSLPRQEAPGGSPAFSFPACFPRAAWLQKANRAGSTACDVEVRYRARARSTRTHCKILEKAVSMSAVEESVAVEAPVTTPEKSAETTVITEAPATAEELAPSEPVPETAEAAASPAAEEAVAEAAAAVEETPAGARARPSAPPRPERGAAAVLCCALVMHVRAAALLGVALRARAGDGQAV